MQKKQKIEINEDLNVSIFDILKSDINLKSPNTKEHFQYQFSNDSEETPKEPDCRAELSKTIKHTPESELVSDIKKMIPKFEKISLQHQRSGRGGKTVTLVYISGKAELKAAPNIEALLKELKKSLGCGGRIEEGKLVLQGEIADRASEWFVKMGAKAVKNT